MIVITVARKPLAEGTVAANVLTHGTGALNIDGCRIGVHQNTTPSGMDRLNSRLHEMGYRPGSYTQGTPVPSSAIGRWPANLMLQHLSECTYQGTERVRANQSSAPGSGVGHASTQGHGIYQAGMGGKVKPSTADAEGMEIIDVWKCVEGCPASNLQTLSVDRYFKQIKPS